MLKIEHLSFVYPDGKVALHDLSVELANGELLSVMGPSGCGKSTLLHLIAGLLSPTSGILKNDFHKIAFCFQEPRLFPWLTVEQNLLSVLPRRSDPSAIREILDLMELPDTADLYPSQLSGGMKSRVSLARALIYGADLCLLDEPFAALNEDLRKKLLERSRDYLAGKGCAAILVTHQRDDALAFSHRLLELSMPE